MFEKLRLLLKRDLNMANFNDTLLELYGERMLFRMEEPLPYQIFPPGTDTLTYADWTYSINRMANVMKDKLGVERGDRVVIIPNNGVEVAGLAMAAMRIGAIAVPLNFMLRAPEIKYIGENCDPRVIFTDKQIFDSSIKEKSLLPQVEKWVFAGMNGEAPEGFESLDLLLKGCPKECKPADISGDDVIAIFYTSGTTGFPKGAMLTSKGFLGANKTAAALLPIGKKDLAVFCLPLAHMFGFGISILGAAAGARGYIMQYFNPHKVLEVMEKHKATLFVGVPAM